MLDYLISAMAAKGMTAFCNLLMGEDLSTGVAGSWTNAQFQAYGNAVATRYASYPNIVWMMGDDGGTGATGPTEIMIGVRAAGDTRPVSFENAQETTSRYGLKLNDVQQWVSSGYIVYQWCYSYAPCYGCVEYAYLESSPIPVLRGDGYYYGTIGGKDDEVAREQFWWAISSGSKGYSWGVGAGNAGSAFASGWASYMTQAGDEAGTAGDFQNRVMPLVTAFVKALPNWQKLAADASNTLITAGRGTRAPYQTEGVQNQYTGATPDTYVSGSYAADGSIAMIYFSRGVTTTITINQTLLASGYTATWVDPANTATTTGTPGSTYTKQAGANWPATTTGCWCWRPRQAAAPSPPGWPPLREPPSRRSPSSPSWPGWPPPRAPLAGHCPDRPRCRADRRDRDCGDTRRTGQACCRAGRRHGHRSRPLP